jgi:hypothetical protein
MEGILATLKRYTPLMDFNQKVLAASANVIIATAHRTEVVAMATPFLFRLMVRCRIFLIKFNT